MKKSILSFGVLSDYRRIMIIDGRAIANDILVDLHEKVEHFPIKPRLSVILV